MIEPTYNLTKTVALYCRVSTEEQAREGISLDEQQERLKAYCRAMGWDDMPLIYIDDGYSAKNLERPQLNKLLTDINEGTISKVLVTKLDRISRKLLDLLKLIEIFQSKNVSFVSISESFDTNTSPGRLTLQVLGAVAEFERERIRERVFENMLHAANHGKWLSQSPYGYDLIDKELVINDEEVKVVERIFDLYNDKGLGFYTIAKQLNEEGIPSKQKKEWSIRSIKLVLTNPAYKGTLVWNRIDRSKEKQVEKNDDDWITVDNSHPAIIDTNTWDAVQKKLQQKQIHPRSKTSPHLLGGLLKCGRCGAAMTIGWMGPRNNRRRVYRCSGNKNKGTCTSKTYNASDVEEWFKNALHRLSKMVDESYVFLIAARAKAEEKHVVQQQIHSAKNRYKRKVEAYTAGLIELDDLQKEKERMERIVSQAENIETTTSVKTTELEEMINQKITSVIEAINTLPIIEAKALVQSLIEKIILYEEKKLEIVLKTP